MVARNIFFNGVGCQPLDIGLIAKLYCGWYIDPRGWIWAICSYHFFVRREGEKLICVGPRLGGDQMLVHCHISNDDSNGEDLLRQTTNFGCFGIVVEREPCWEMR